MQEKYFQGDNVIDDVSHRVTSRPFLYIPLWIKNNIYIIISDRLFIIFENFGKHAISECPFILYIYIYTCQNLQVCSSDGLLLAKISQKFGKYVRLTVCLSVCVSRDTVRSYWPILSKLGPHMESGPTHRPILFLGQRSNN